MRGKAYPSAIWLAAGLAALLSTPLATLLPGQEPPPGELERLMQLSSSGAAKEGSRSAGDWVSRCREQVQSARTYTSWLIKRDFLMPHLQPRGFAYVEWRLEAVRPDRLHVRQVIHEQAPLGELREERIAIGAEHFLGGASWSKADAQSAADYAELNRFLLLDKFAELLRVSKFILLGTVTSNGRRYALLETDHARITGYPMLSEFSEVKGRARVWIDEETGLPAKVELEFKGKDAGDNPVHKGFAQVFTAYNQPLTIDPPPLKP